VDITFSNIQGGWEGDGNIDTAPLFRDPDNGDFHLMSTACGDPYDSPCIDTGNPAIIDSLLDCDWGLGTILSDMGAYGGGDSVMVGIDDYIVDLPDKFALLQNYPNPFNPSTTIRYNLPTQSDVRIEIYNILGQKVATLFDGNKQAGHHNITWQADNFPSGVYFARMETGMLSESIKMVLLK
ncbi:MAG: T9SS type A sorting domain-containing protein, partial [candidate division Zixibacteria bacterium]